MYRHLRLKIFILVALASSFFSSLMVPVDASAVTNSKSNHFRWVNAVTIEEREGGGFIGYSHLRYYSLDSGMPMLVKDGGTYADIKDGGIFKPVEKVKGYCEFQIHASAQSYDGSGAPVGLSDGMFLQHSVETSGSCGDMVSDYIEVSGKEAKAHVYAYVDEGGYIRPVDVDKFNKGVSFDPIRSDLLSSSLKNSDSSYAEATISAVVESEVYYESSPSGAECPALLFKSGASGNWAFVRPKKPDNTTKTDAASSLYRDIVSAGGVSNVGACEVSVSRGADGGKGTTEKGLEALIFGNLNLWNDSGSARFQPCGDKWVNYFNGILKSAYCLGANFVGTEADSPHTTGVAVPRRGDDTGSEVAEVPPTCLVEGVGWIVCPVMNFIASVTDGMYGVVEGVLTVPSDLVSTDSGAHRGWEVMRDISNAGLIIAFILIVFSQMTSIGISNYGIKRMLPRLVMAAILINVSFFVSQLAVDLSNVLGVSIKNILSGLPVFEESATGAFAEGDIFGEVTAAILVGGVGIAGATVALAGAALYGGVGLLLMIILAAVLAVAVTFLIVSARMALIVILVVVSPLAFLAMVLPNTRSWYERWQKVFVSLLAIFPMIAVVFGASQMAGQILIQSGESITMVILGLGVATIPLFAVLPMLKGSLNAVPAVGKFAQRLSGARPMGGRIKKGMSEARAGMSNSVRNRALSGSRLTGGRVGKRIASGRARLGQKNQSLAGDVQRQEAQLMADEALKEGSGASQRQQAAAIGSLSKLSEEEIGNIMTLDQYNGATPEDHLKRIGRDDSSEAEKIASIRAIAERGGQGDKDKLVNISNGLKPRERQAVAAMAAAGGKNNFAYGGKTVADIAKGTFNSDEAYSRAMASSEYNAQRFIDAHGTSRDSMLESLSGDNNPDREGSLKGMRSVLSQIEGSEEMRSKVNPDVVEKLRSAIATTEGKMHGGGGGGMQGELDLRGSAGGAGPTPPTA